MGRSGEGIGFPLQYFWASLVAQTVKNLPAMWEIWVRSLGWGDALEEGMATHSSILVWRIPWTEEPVAESDITEGLSTAQSNTLELNTYWVFTITRNYATHILV